MSKLAERVGVAMGVRRNFSRGVQSRHFAYLLAHIHTIESEMDLNH